MAAFQAAGLAQLREAAASPLAHPTAAQLLPGAQAAEGIPRLERLLLAAAARAPRELSPAARDLVRAGGKRVRPLLVLLASRAAAPGRRARGRLALALVSELVHSATLLHDDVIDDGLTRRGQPAPRVAYGNGVSVLAGGWLLPASLRPAPRPRAAGAGGTLGGPPPAAAQGAGGVARRRAGGPQARVRRAAGANRRAGRSEAHRRDRARCRSRGAGGRSREPDPRIARPGRPRPPLPHELTQRRWARASRSSRCCTRRPTRSPRCSHSGASTGR